ncbi:P2X purinoceptor 7-like [Hyperolius riggenbachi]|uniref:P2X purinoceptor 7-like n=1 Tax=Hyperolius riggenbachi TaxID=752182 RepID=UPI0035A2AF89
MSKENQIEEIASVTNSESSDVEYSLATASFSTFSSELAAELASIEEGENIEQQDTAGDDSASNSTRKQEIDQFMQRFWNRLPDLKDDPSWYEKSSTVSLANQSTVLEDIPPTDTPQEPEQRTFDWCECGNCTPMKTEIEEVCCCQIEEVGDKIRDGKTCVTQVDFFKNMFINEEYVETNFRSNPNITEHPDDRLYNRKLRKTAYRSFTCWVYGYLGKKQRRPIPSCAVKMICDAFPDPLHLYTGFLFPDDYNAADMIDL